MCRQLKLKALIWAHKILAIWLTTTQTWANRSKNASNYLYGGRALDPVVCSNCYLFDVAIDPFTREDRRDEILNRYPA
jgi:hypothetical protein